MASLPALKDSKLAVEGRVATLTFARDDIRNALTGTEIANELLATLDWANGNPDISVLVLTGAGAAFSAGGNVKRMRERSATASLSEIMRYYVTGIQKLPVAFEAAEVVTIAAVNGPAVGAGCDLTCMCDLRIASANAQFGETFVNLGIVPGDGGAWYLPRLLGYQKAAEMTFTGRLLKADEALACGLVLEVVPPEQLLQRVAKLAATIAAKPPLALRYGKRLLRQAERQTLPEHLEMCAALQAIAHKTEDHMEALNAFFEKRPGSFRGR